MSILRKLLCKMGSHPHRQFIKTPGTTEYRYQQCLDCKRIQQFAVQEKWDATHKWIDEPDWLTLHRNQQDVKHD